MPQYERGTAEPAEVEHEAPPGRVAVLPRPHERDGLHRPRSAAGSLTAQAARRASGGSSARSIGPHTTRPPSGPGWAPSAPSTCARRRAAGQACPWSSRAGSRSSSTRPSRWTQPPACGCIPRCSWACPARTGSPPWPRAYRCTSSWAMARQAPRFTTLQGRAIRPGWCSPRRRSSWSAAPTLGDYLIPQRSEILCPDNDGRAAGNQQRCQAAARQQPLGQRDRRAVGPPHRRPLYRAHLGHRGARAPLHAHDHHRRVRWRAAPGARSTGRP